MFQRRNFFELNDVAIFITHSFTDQIYIRSILLRFRTVRILQLNLELHSSNLLYIILSIETFTFFLDRNINIKRSCQTQLLHDRLDAFQNSSLDFHYFQFVIRTVDNKSDIVFLRFQRNTITIFIQLFLEEAHLMNRISFTTNKALFVTVKTETFERSYVTLFISQPIDITWKNTRNDTNTSDTVVELQEFDFIVRTASSFAPRLSHILFPL